MELFCKQFAGHNGSTFSKFLVFHEKQKEKEVPKETQKETEEVDEAALQQAKKDYSEKWDTLKKFRDKDPATFEKIGVQDKENLSARATIVIKKFEAKLKADKTLIDPEKIYAVEKKDKERIQTTLMALDEIIDKYGNEKKGATPEWLKAEVLKPFKGKFQKAAKEASDKVRTLTHPILGGGDKYKNPGTNDYVRSPEALAMLENLNLKISGLSKTVETSGNMDFIEAATAEMNAIDQEIQKALAVDAGRSEIFMSIFDAFKGANGGMSFRKLPRASRTDKMLIERLESRMALAKGFNIEKVPPGTVWKFEQEGVTVSITKGEGRKCTAKIDNVMLHLLPEYGPTFVKYLAPEDKKYVKSVNQTTGEVVVERTYPVAPGDVPPALVKQYKKLDPEFDKDPSPKRIKEGADMYIVSREVQKGRKQYKVERVFSS